MLFYKEKHSFPVWPQSLKPSSIGPIRNRHLGGKYIFIYYRYLWGSGADIQVEISFFRASHHVCGPISECEMRDWSWSVGTEAHKIKITSESQLCSSCSIIPGLQTETRALPLVKSCATVSRFHINDNRRKSRRFFMTPGPLQSSTFFGFKKKF